MTTPFQKYNFLFLLTLCVLLSCKVIKKYQRPPLNTLDLFRGQTTGDTISMADMPWQTLFTDTTLKALIAEGLYQNLNLKIAIQRIAEAEATFNQSKAAFYPNLSANTSVTRSRLSPASLGVTSETTGTAASTTSAATSTTSATTVFSTLSTVYQLGLNSSWEADVWGQLKSAKKAAFANLLETDAAKRAVQTQLIADIADNYFNLLALDRQLEILVLTVNNRVKDVEAMKALKEGAVVNGAAVVQAEANRYAAEVAIPDVKRSIRETENEIDFLVGRSPGPLNHGKLAAQTITTNLQTGIPDQLLKNRPDVQQAEYAFRAAFENTNVAHTYFYPALTITASGGFNNLQLKDFFVNSIFYNIAAGLTQPIFNQGINKARLKTAQAQQLEALLNFQQTLLTAGQEVSNALYAYQSGIDKDSSRSKEIAALQKSVEYTQELLRYSSATNYNDVLTSEQNLLSAQLSGVNDRLQQLQAIVNLYRALGGGWK